MSEQGTKRERERERLKNCGEIMILECHNKEYLLHLMNF